MGGLPFPGPLTLYEMADPLHLGTHSYPIVPRFSLPHSEQYRGTIYTCNAGFLDIAHMRKAADCTKHFHAKVTEALLDGQTSIQVEGEEPSHYLVSINYPPFWPHIPGEERGHRRHDTNPGSEKLQGA